MAEKRERPAKVQLFHSLFDEVDTEAGVSVVRILERLGLGAEAPHARTCCGESELSLTLGVCGPGAVEIVVGP